MTVNTVQRFTKERPCPVCGGYDKQQRSQGKRCYGFRSADEEWVHCTRGELAGGIPMKAESDTYAHRLTGDCRCGQRHDNRPPNPKRGSKRPSRRIVATYDYTDEDGTILFQTVRYDPKDFSQRRPDGNGGWIWNLKGVSRVLYRLRELIAADSARAVFVCEGEKDVDLLIQQGLTATTNPMGAGKWRPEYSGYLEGRHVVVLPDNDGEGRSHAEKVAYSVQSIARSVRVVELSGLPEGGGDISDWLDQGHTAQELMELARNAPEWEPPEKQEAPQGVLRFQSAADIARETPQDTQWIVRPIVPSEAIVEVSGKVKVAGKTTFLMAMSRKVLGGLDFMGEPTRQTPVVYLTEQPRSSLREALRRADLLDREDFRILRYSDTIGTPWPRVVEAAAKECKRVGAKLLVVDTLPQFAGIRDDEENSTGAALEALEPIQAVVAMGTAVVVIRHDGKADRNVGDSARGASQWSGVPDIIISVRRGEGNSSPTVRVLHTLSRFDETPDKLVIDLQGGEYVSLGTETRVAILVAKEALLSGAPISEESSVDANKLIEEADGVKPTVGNQAISELVQEGKLLRRGAGKRGDARRYWNPESIHPLIGNTVPNELNIGGTTSAERADQPSGGDSNTPALIDSFATTTLYTDESINDAVEEGEI